MSCIYVHEIKAEGVLGLLPAGTTATRRFQVGFDNDDASYSDVPGATDGSQTAPLIGDPHSDPSLGSIYCIGINVNRINETKANDEGGVLFELVATYGSNTSIINPGVNPLDVPKRIYFATDTVTKDCDLAWRDTGGGTYVRDQHVWNSAFQFFDPSPQYDTSRFLITITRNEATFPFTTITNYINTVNSASFNLKINHTSQTIAIPAKTARMINVTAEEASALVAGSEVKYCVVTYTILIDTNDFRLKIVDAGTKQVLWWAAYSFYKIVNITDTNQQPITEPVPLNGSGLKLTIPELPALPSLHILNYDIYKPVSWSGLNFDV